jgi:hypothetical protein
MQLALSIANGVRIVWTDAGHIAGIPPFRIMGLVAQRIVGNAMVRGLAALKTEARAKQGGGDALAA